MSQLIGLKGENQQVIWSISYQPSKAVSLSLSGHMDWQSEKQGNFFKHNLLTICGKIEAS